MMTMTSRPRPVMILTMISAGLAAIAGFGGLSELIPDIAVKWITLIDAAYVAIVGIYLQSIVTPVNDPQNKLGQKLVPAERNNK